jgi:hypothetical protein
VIPSNSIASIHVLHAAALSKERQERIAKILREFAKGDGQFSNGLHLAALNIDPWEAVLLTTEGKIFLLSECAVPPALFVTSCGQSGVVPIGQ